MRSSAALRKDKPAYTCVIAGKYWYFRHKAIGQIALPHSPGHPEFHRKYADLLERAQGVAANENKYKADSLKKLVDRYLGSPEFRLLAADTRRDYERHLALLVENAGDLPWRELDKQGLIAARNHFAKTRSPRTGNKVVAITSLMFSWLVNQAELAENPLLGTAKLNVKGSYTPWSEEQIAKFLSEAEPHMALGVAIGVGTGQRLKDCIRMAAVQYENGWMRVRQEKTGEFISVPCPKFLRDLLDARPHPDAPMLVLDKDGKPFASERKCRHYSDLRAFSATTSSTSSSTSAAMSFACRGRIDACARQRSISGWMRCGSALSLIASRRLSQSWLRRPGRTRD